MVTGKTLCALATIALTSALAAGPAHAGDTSTALTSSQNPSTYGQTVAFTATVAGRGPPSGTVTFMKGAETLGSGDLESPGAGPSLGDGTSLAPGGNFTCARTAAGSVKCWGWNFYGQLGDGTTTSRDTPVDVTGLSSGVAAIATGDYHSCALTDAGGVKCWGLNDDGQLGDGTTADSDTPVDVVGLSSGVAAIAGGEHYTCALTDAGGLQCWGANVYGQLGDGTTDNSDAPIDVDGLSRGVVAIAASDRHTCALTDIGGARCWGRNNSGDLGDGTTTNRHTPVAVVDFGPDAALATFSTDALSAGSHSITVHYGGDTYNDAGTSPALTHIVDKGDTEAKVKLKPKKPKAGKSVRIKITIAAVAPSSGKPDGKVVVKDGRKKLGKFKVKNGKAKIKLRDLKAGKHTIKAKYPGDKNLEKSAAKASFTAR